MIRTLTASDLRAQIQSVLNEVSQGQTAYVVEKFGEPVAAIISMDDYRLLQTLKEPPGTAHAPSAFERELEAIHTMLAANGHQPRTRAEIDADLQAERGSWTG